MTGQRYATLAERRVTREEFEAGYAERSGITVEQLRNLRLIVPCDCGDEACRGWAAVSRNPLDRPSDTR